MHKKIHCTVIAQSVILHLGTIFCPLFVGNHLSLSMLQQIFNTMEKFSLKWNDFQTNVSKTFSSLRQEEHLFDVTLVSDDEEHIAAHKLVLTASSQFFKNILKKASHASPMIFLSGFKSSDLLLIMDYIYQGEVQILQSDLDGFLEVAQRLRIEGLIGKGEEENTYSHDDDRKDFMDSTYGEQQDEEFTDMSVTSNSKPVLAAKKSISRAERTVSVVCNSTNFDAKAAVDDLVEKTDDGWRCKACGKTTKTLDIRRHAEMHIEGLSFDCQHCDKTFRSRQILADHKRNNHRKHNI